MQYVSDCNGSGRMGTINNKRSVVLVLCLLLGLGLCAWILARSREEPPPWKESQTHSVYSGTLSSKHHLVAANSRNDGAKWPLSSRLTVSGPAPRATQSLPNDNDCKGQCPFRKGNLSDLELPPLPNITGKQQRLYLKTPWGAPIIWNNTQANAAARLQEGPFNIGLTVTVVGQSYATFLQRMITSADEYFMNGQNVTYFVFTDDLSLGTKIKSKRRIVALKVKDKGWPCNTLLRFEPINTFKNRLAGMHFLYTLDVDVYFEDTVGTEILEYLVATLHVLYFLGPRTGYTYDTNPLSTAYINKSEGEYYYAGGFFGGCRDAIFQMAETIERNIRKDLKEQHYIARWHDESHLNKYLIDNHPTKVLSPEYLFFTSYLPTPNHKIQRKRLINIEKGVTKLVTKWLFARDWQQCS